MYFPELGRFSRRSYDRVLDQEDGKISCVANGITPSSVLIGGQKGSVSIFNAITGDNLQLPHVSRQRGKEGLRRQPEKSD